MRGGERLTLNDEAIYSKSTLSPNEVVVILYQDPVITVVRGPTITRVACGVVARRFIVLEMVKSEV